MKRDLRTDASPWSIRLGEAFTGILAAIGAQPDFTLDEIVSALHKQQIPGGRSALSRFFARHGMTAKKKPAGGRAQASRHSSLCPDDEFVSKGFSIRPPRIYRRDCGQHEHGAAQRLEPAW